jgi:hypothetical protein
MKLLCRSSFLLTFLFVSVVGLAAAQTSSADRPAAANIDPQCQQLKEQLLSLEPVPALIALERFEATHENVIGCPVVDLHNRLSEYERKLVRLVDKAGELAPQLTLRCAKLNHKTTHCQGIYADDTALVSESWFPRLRSLNGPLLTIKSDIPDTEIVGVYRSRLSSYHRGDSPIPIRRRGSSVTLQPLPKDSVIIVVLRLKGDWAHWRYRKIVWFF